MENTIRKKTFIEILLICIMFVMVAGCSSKEADKVTIDDVVEIPENGIISQEQFEAFAGTDRSIEFVGESDGIQYQWNYPGKNIHNPREMDLSIDFMRDDLENIKEISGGASYALGMKLKGQELITIPTLTIELPEVWDADIAVFCKEKDGTAFRICDAEMKVSSTTTTISVKVTEVGDIYYIVAGKSENLQDEEITTVSESGFSRETKMFSQSDKSAEVKTEEATTKESKSKIKEKYDNPNSEITGKKESQSKRNSDGKSSSELTCTFSITCETLLSNMDNLEASKKRFVPSDGKIVKPTEVTIQAGDSVFDVLLSVCREQKIHMEHSGTPVYGSEYIEGINQIYEYDCGELSGWMYKVDGWFPNYGSDKYTLSGGEEIEFVYTCDLGKDVGNTSRLK